MGKTNTSYGMNILPTIFSIQEKEKIKKAVDKQVKKDERRIYAKMLDEFNANLQEGKLNKHENILAILYLCNIILGCLWFIDVFLLSGTYEVVILRLFIIIVFIYGSLDN